MLKELFKYIFKGVIYSAASAILGALFSIIKGWSLLKGAYIFVLALGSLTMVISVILLIGTPSIRRGYFERDEEGNYKNPNRGAEGLGPALMGMVMVIIGFALEAFLH